MKVKGLGLKIMATKYTRAEIQKWNKEQLIAALLTLDCECHLGTEQYNQLKSQYDAMEKQLETDKNAINGLNVSLQDSVDRYERLQQLYKDQRQLSTDLAKELATQRSRTNTLLDVIDQVRDPLYVPMSISDAVLFERRMKRVVTKQQQEASDAYEEKLPA